jgi:Tfp pilus assembly protein PilV
VLGVEGLVVTVAMVVMVVAVAAVIRYILRNRLDEPDLPTERSVEQSRAHAGERSNHSGMGPF